MSVQSRLPVGWSLCTLEEVCTLKYGKGLPVSKLKPQGYSVFGANGVIGFYDQYMYEEEQVLISCRGANSGNINVSPKKSFITNNSLVLEINGQLPDLKQFLRHVLISKNKKTMISGSAQPQITIKDADQFQIPFPPLPEQRRIVSKIESLQERSDRARQSLEAIPPLLEKFRQSVLASAFRGDLTKAWREKNPNVEPASELLKRIRVERRRRWEEAELEKMRAKGKEPKGNAWKERYKEPEPVDTEGLPELPEGWVWSRAEEICDLITKGTTPSKNKMFPGLGEVPYIKVYNLTFSTALDYSINPTFVSEETHRNELARSIVFPGDVLMNIVGPPLGKVSIVPSTYPEWNMNQAISVFRPLGGYLPSLLARYLLHDWVLSWAKLRSKATAGQFNLTLEICRNLPVPIIPLDEQLVVINKFSRFFELQESLIEKTKTDQTLFSTMTQSILAKAFRGELVPQDPNDEPASVLLERIKAETGKGCTKTTD